MGEDGRPTYDSTVDEKKLIKILDPVDLLAPIAIKFWRLRQRYNKADLEWDEPLRGELAKEKMTLSCCRHFKIVGARDRAEVVRDPAINEPAVNSRSGAEAWRPAIFNAAWWNTVGQRGGITAGSRSSRNS